MAKSFLFFSQILIEKNNLLKKFVIELNYFFKNSNCIFLLFKVLDFLTEKS